MATTTIKEARGEDSVHALYGSDFDSVLTRNLYYKYIIFLYKKTVIIYYVRYLDGAVRNFVVSGNW